MSSPNFLIYDASAGSGKTYALTKEYLKILLTSSAIDAYKKILAITFTNKAVNEMKHRIISSLLEFTKEVPSDKAQELLNDISKDFLLTEEEIKQKSKLIIKNIIHNYASFDISTIDKFTHRLIRTFAIDLGLPVTFEISLDTNSIVKEAVDRLIAKAGTDEILTSFLIDFALTKVTDGGSWDFTNELISIGKLISNENHDKELEQIKNITLDNFIEIRNSIKESKTLILEGLIEKAKNLLSYIDNQPYGLAAFKTTLPNQLNKIILNDFQNSSFIKGFKYVDISDLENKVYKKMLSEVTPDFDYIFSEIQDLKKIIGYFLMYDNILKNITPLSLLNSIANEVKLIQQEQNILSISEFNKIIHQQIQNQPAPYIYERLGDKYRHFFIDEFQDTSEKQWKNLIPLIDSALSESANVEEGSLMLVGDAKQSIYRWRGGKAEQFIDLSKDDQNFNPFSNKNKKPERLGVNYRSYSEVIEFNNLFFKNIAGNLILEDYKALYAEKSSQKINNKVGGFVSIEFLPNLKELNSEKEDDEEDIVADDLYLEKTLKAIKNCKDQGFNYGDIAILTRLRSKGVLIANYLIENAIPIISSETLLLSNSDDVNFIVSILQLLNNFNDNEARFLALYYIQTNFVPNVSVHDFVIEGIKKNTEKEFEAYIEAHTFLKFSFEANKKQDLYQVCENIISVFLSDKSNIAYVQFFLDIVIEQEAKQLGLDEFLNYWKTKTDSLSIPSPEDVDAVKIMTVHKSKGLEFPVVIFPFVNDTIIKNNDKMWIDLPATDKVTLSKTLISKKGEVGLYNEQAAHLLEIMDDEVMLDTINVLYVALTRAGEQLYVITEKKQNAKGEFNENYTSTFFANFLMNIKAWNPDQEVYTFGECKKYSKNAEIKQSPTLIETVENANLKASSIKLAQKEALMWGSTRGESITFGNLIHDLLSQIEYIDQVEVTVDTALRKGKLEYKDYERVKYILKNIVNHPDLSEHFNSNVKVFNERNIINFNFNTIKPDRVTICNNRATLLDYKTGKKSDAHIKQIADYEKALLEMGYHVVKKTLVYIGDEIEEIVNL